MAKKPRHLIVVPTGGWVRTEHGQLVPNHLGTYRLKKAAELLTAHSGALLAIAGKEAHAHYQTFADQWPEFAERVVILDASCYYTAGDMVALAERIDEWEDANGDIGRFARITMVSHPDHAWLALRSLNAGFRQTGDRNFRIEASGEPASRTWWEQAILNWVTRHDLRWERWLSWPLRMIARFDKRNV